MAARVLALSCAFLMSRTRRLNPTLLLLALAAGMPADAQFKAVGSPPYTPAVARQKIKALLAKVDPPNRQQTIDTISGLLIWYREIAADELIAVWKKDDGRENLPDVIRALADARVASEVVQFSWRQKRETTFQLSYVPLFEDLMLRFPDSAKPFLDDLLGSGAAAGQPPPELNESEAYAVCRILLDMPDIRTWKQSGLQILPHYREVAQTLLAADLRQTGEEPSEKRYRILYWRSALGSGAAAPASSPSPRASMQPSATAAPPAPAASVARPSLEVAKSGTLECGGGPILPNAEYVFQNVPTENRRFDYDRKIWEVRLEPGEGDTKNFILKNKSASAQKRCVVRWTVIP